SNVLYVLAGVAVLAGIYVFASTTQWRAAVPGVRGGDGRLAGDFTLEALDGGELTLKSLRGKVVFLNFWATWCAPCRDEMPSMQVLDDSLGGNPDFVMIAVSQDERGRQAVKPYVEKNGFRFKVLLDPDGRLASSYGLTGVPETFIIDRSGRIVAHHMGAFDWSRPDVRDALKRMLEVKQG
ncbi:MAG: TlpA family protein disulfide reductase, partial [Candidatus Binataceae bacterium]